MTSCCSRSESGTWGLTSLGSLGFLQQPLPYLTPPTPHTQAAEAARVLLPEGHLDVLPRIIHSHTTPPPPAPQTQERQETPWGLFHKGTNLIHGDSTLMTWSLPKGSTS